MEQRISGKAIAGFVCGILSIFMPFLGFVLGVLGIVFGVIARKEIQHSNRSLTGEGMAIAGFICGIVGVTITVAMFALFGIIASKVKPFFFDTMRWT